MSEVEGLGQVVFGNFYLGQCHEMDILFFKGLITFIRTNLFTTLYKYKLFIFL
jgi:hypothetical protein